MTAEAPRSKERPAGSRRRRGKFGGEATETFTLRVPVSEMAIYRAVSEASGDALADVVRGCAREGLRLRAQQVGGFRELLESLEAKRLAKKVQERRRVVESFNKLFSSEN